MAGETEREGKGKGKKRRTQVPEGSASGSSQQEAEETLTREAEDSLGEKEPSKRRRETLLRRLFDDLFCG